MLFGDRARIPRMCACTVFSRALTVGPPCLSCICIALHVCWPLRVSRFVSVRQCVLLCHWPQCDAECQIPYLVFCSPLLLPLSPIGLGWRTPSRAFEPPLPFKSGCSRLRTASLCFRTVLHSVCQLPLRLLSS